MSENEKYLLFGGLAIGAVFLLTMYKKNSDLAAQQNAYYSQQQPQGTIGDILSSIGSGSLGSVVNGLTDVFSSIGGLFGSGSNDPGLVDYSYDSYSNSPGLNDYGSIPPISSSVSDWGSTSTTGYNDMGGSLLSATDTSFYSDAGY